VNVTQGAVTRGKKIYLCDEAVYYYRVKGVPPAKRGFRTLSHNNKKKVIIPIR